MTYRILFEMNVYTYLRASTEDQDATRAVESLQQFATDHSLTITGQYVENVSGTKLDRPELMRLIGDAVKGDILLIEQIDRLTRLTADDWSTLKTAITSKGIKIVSMDLPTSLMVLKNVDDAFMDGIMSAVNSMLMDILATTARKDYTDRRRRQDQGIAKAKAEGKFKGRQITAEGQAKIDKFWSKINSGMSVADSSELAGFKRAYGYKLIAKAKAEA